MRKTTKPLILFCIVVILLHGCTGSLDPNPEALDIKLTAADAGDRSPSSWTNIKERGLLIVGTALTKPFVFHDPDTDKLIGFDIDLVNYIAEQLGVNVKFVEMPFANLIPALQERKVDMIIAAMYITPERMKDVDFSTPYLMTGLIMVVPPELQAQVSTVQDLAGRKVGVKIGSTGSQLAQELMAQNIALEVFEYKDTFSSFLDLEVGRVDVIFNDYINSLVYINDTHSDLEIAAMSDGEVNFLSHTGLGVAVYQGDYELLEEIDDALTNMNEDGTFEQVYKTWLSPERH